MCGRYTLKTPVDVLMQMFHVAWPDDASPGFNIAPTQQAPVITGSRFNPRIREVRMVRWGLVPSWAEDFSIGSRMINARSESASGRHRQATRLHPVSGDPLDTKKPHNRLVGRIGCQAPCWHSKVGGTDKGGWHREMRGFSTGC